MSDLKKYCCASHKGGVTYGNSEYDDYTCPCRKGTFTVSSGGMPCGYVVISQDSSKKEVEVTTELSIKVPEVKYLDLPKRHPLYWATFSCSKNAEEAMYRVNKLLGED